jgi:hypothetical protein
MLTQVADLYESTRTKYKIKLHCGESGMRNFTSWVYLAEDIQNISFLKGGELIITTGLFSQSGVTLYEFIRSLAISNCSGILINEGQYLHPADITPEIVSFCDVNKIPLLSMPWEIHLVDIMQDLCSLYLRDKQTDDRINVAFQSAIYQEQIPESILRVLNQYGFSTQTPYSVLVIRNLDSISRITSPLNRYGLKYHLFQHDNLHVLIYDSAQKQISLEELIEVICYCDSITVGISDATHLLKEIGVAYKHAQFSLAVAEHWKRTSACFGELGVYQLLFYAPDIAFLQAQYQRQLGNLEKYDLEHNSDYIHTLKVYLESDCDLLETAARMHTHRNTVVYRIRKIKEILCSDLNNSAVKFDIMLSFHIKEYLSM